MSKEGKWNHAKFSFAQIVQPRNGQILEECTDGIDLTYRLWTRADERRYPQADRQASMREIWDDSPCDPDGFGWDAMVVDEEGLVYIVPEAELADPDRKTEMPRAQAEAKAELHDVRVERNNMMKRTPKKQALTPYNVPANSHMVVWWKCKNGHEWQDSVDNRVKGSNCPICEGQTKQPPQCDEAS